MRETGDRLRHQTDTTIPLLGQRSGRITTHYPQAELTSLIEAAEKVCDTESRNHLASAQDGLAAEALTG
jgi:hypothetical protein